MDGADLQDGLARVRTHFLELLPDRLMVVDQALTQTATIDDPALIASHLSKASDVLHKVGGTAGMLGFRDLGMTARIGEAKYIALQGNPSPDKQAATTAAMHNFCAEARGVLQTP